MKPFLILQLRPEDDASDGEFRAFLEKGRLDESDTHRIRLDAESLPEGCEHTPYGKAMANQVIILVYSIFRVVNVNVCRRWEFIANIVDTGTTGCE